MEDENTSPSERAAAEARLSENEAELDRINTEIEVRERERPLLERVKDIFKKYGWTLQAIFVAVGVILSVIALTVKKGTKVISQKLNNVKHEPGFHWLNRELHFQSREPSLRLPEQAHLVDNPCRCGLLHGKAS